MLVCARFSGDDFFVLVVQSLVDKGKTKTRKRTRDEKREEGKEREERGGEGQVGKAAPKKRQERDTLKL